MQYKSRFFENTQNWRVYRNIMVSYTSGTRWWQHKPIKIHILQEVRALQQLEQLNPQDNQESRKQFLSYFHCSDSTLYMEARKAIKDLLVEFHEIFTKQRFVMSINNDFKVKLTPIDEITDYCRSLPTPIKMKEDITVKLALLLKWGFITTLAFSISTSPSFAKGKPNGKLRLFVELGQVKNMISGDYINNIHPVSTLTDAAQHS